MMIALHNVNMISDYIMLIHYKMLLMRYSHCFVDVILYVKDII